MKVKLEIAGEKVLCHQDGQEAISAPVRTFFDNYLRRAEAKPHPDAIPETMRFCWTRGEITVVALEERPAVRTVRWLDPDSPAKFGEGALYEERRLAFPFVVLIIAFTPAGLTGKQQCFYRKAPLTSLEDELYLPNLFNVAEAYGQHAWLCLANMKSKLGGVAWGERVRQIWTHVFEAGFNASSEVHEGNSMWGSMQSIDKRVSSLDAWEQASAQDPFFPLKVEWKKLGQNTGQVMEQMIDSLCPRYQPATAGDLVPLFQAPRRRPFLQGLLFK